MQLNHSQYFNKSNLLALAISWLVCLMNTASPVAAQQYPGVKCVVDGNLQCKVQYSVEFGQGNVFFGNKAGFEHFQNNVLRKLKRGQQPERSLVLKANHQLALTNQVRQKCCPVSGKPFEKEHHLVIAGVKVFFHDSTAREKMQAAESTWHRAQQVFTSDAFAKSFVRAKPVRAKQEPQKAITVADGSTKPPLEKSSQAKSRTTR